MKIKNVKAHINKRNKLYFSKENIRFFGVSFISEGVLVDGILYFYEKQTQTFSDGSEYVTYPLKSFDGTFKTIERYEREVNAILTLSKIKRGLR